ncbi:class I SAM-dependent methyltransferase [Hoeflea sp. AS60]|uniref:class I SAM-dependent methyltransferase n=1 Tax=Hoeflea sp. AS60 TaxID=3135780 RepID=UPI00317E75D6
MSPAPKEYDATLFAGTAKYYSKYRIGYPGDLFDALYRHSSFESANPVLDLGCGTGHVAIGLAEKGIIVYAVDPDPEMVAEGVRAASQRNLTTIRWMLGTDRQIGDMKLPALSVCTMGASFHWMDRSRVLKQLDGMIVSDGCVALFSGRFDLEHAETALWNQLASEVIQKFLGPERRAGKGTYSHSSTRHGEILAESPFGKLQTLYFKKRILLTVEQIVGLQLSMSFASPAQLGSAKKEFESVLTEQLTKATDKPAFESVVQYELIIGKR